MSYDQSNIDKLSRERLEAMAAKNDIGGNHIKAQIALEKLDKKEDDESSERRHQETMKGDKIARWMAAAGVLVAVIALWRSETALSRSERSPSPEERSHLSQPGNPADHRRDIAGPQPPTKATSKQVATTSLLAIFNSMI